MALFVCKRKKLLETRSESPDLLAIEHTKDILSCIESYRVAVIGSRKTLYLRLLSGGLTAEGPSIRAEVEEYGPTWLTGGEIRGACMKELGDNYHITWVTGSQYMLVEPPDAHALVSLMEGQILSSLRRSIGFANAMDRFVMRYSHSPQELPLVCTEPTKRLVLLFREANSWFSLLAARSRTRCPPSQLSHTNQLLRGLFRRRERRKRGA